MKDRKKNFLSLAFDSLDAGEATREVVVRSKVNTFSYLVTPNVDHIVQLHKSPDKALRQAYRSADLTICDSRILSRLAHWSRIQLPVAPGSDLTRELLDQALPPCKIALVGGDQELHKAIADKYPQFEWCFNQPPMGVRRNFALQDEIVDFVVSAYANVTLFAIGAPQSELMCFRIKCAGKANGIALCVGASLEFLVGKKQRAPSYMQRAGLEWLFRLVSEPKRLWRRYLVDGPAIFTIWIRWMNATARHRSAEYDSNQSDDG